MTSAQKYPGSNIRSQFAWDPFHRIAGTKDSFSEVLKREIPSKLPLLNIVEEKNNYQLGIAAPGMKEEDFAVEVQENTLIISFERTDDKQKSTKNFLRQEYSYTSFLRTFTLPDDADAKAIKVKYQSGILQITLPKKGTTTTAAKTERTKSKGE